MEAISVLSVFIQSVFGCHGEITTKLDERNNPHSRSAAVRLDLDRLSSFVFLSDSAPWIAQENKIAPRHDNTRRLSVVRLKRRWLNCLSSELEHMLIFCTARTTYLLFLSFDASSGEHLRVGLLWLIISEGMVFCSPAAHNLCDHQQSNPIRRWWVGRSSWILPLLAHLLTAHREKNIRELQDLLYSLHSQ